MQTPSTSTNMTIFLVFFGISLFEAIGSGNWMWAGFWLAIGLLFLGANRLSRLQSLAHGSRFTD